MNEQIPFVSVVVCAFNEQKLLQQCLEGLNRQDYDRSRYEVVVIDDESTDRTFDIASKYVESHRGALPRVRAARIQHGGLSIARNSGIALSEGEIVAFIDGDAIASCNWVTELVNSFQRGADFTGGTISLLNEKSWFAQVLQHTRYQQFFGPDLYSDELVGCNMAFRRHALTEVGGFIENFTRRGDDSSIKIRLRDRFDYIPSPEAVVFHERPETLTEYMRVEVLSGYLSGLVRRAVGMESKTHLGLLSSGAIAAMPIILGLSVFFPKLSLLGLVGVVLMLRKLYFRPYGKRLLKHLMCQFGALRGTLLHFGYCYISNLCSFIGRVMYALRPNRDVIVQPMTTPLAVNALVDTEIKPQHA